MRNLLLPIVLLSLLAYVFWHLWRIVPGPWGTRLAVTGLFGLWMVLAFASLGLSEKVSVRVASIMADAGQPWMIAFLYLLLGFLVADILVLCRVLPKSFLQASPVGTLTLFGLVAATMVAGGIHYRHKYREEMTVHTEKPLEKPLRVVLASDLHLGYGNRRAELARWIDLINAEKPDLVLFGGDIVDLRIRPLVEGDYAAEFHRLEAPAWAVPGNHEFYGGLDGAAQFYAGAGIGLLRDSVVRCGEITVVGRDDHSNPSRKALSQLPVSTDAFTILLDHQPFHLEEAEQAGIDFQFSGHTHRGQVWPLSWVTDAMYEKSWGRHRRGSTQYYVSSGLGIWGPRIRVGTRSEYLVLQIVSSPVQ